MPTVRFAALPSYHQVFNEPEALLDSSIPEPKTRDVLPEGKRHTRKKTHLKDFLPGDIAVEEHHHSELKEGEACPICGHRLVKFAAKQYEHIKIIPAQRHHGCLQMHALRGDKRRNGYLFPFVIGRKNFLFANTPLGAIGSAVYYSLTESCKENGIDPYEYLVFTLKEAASLVEAGKESEIKKLTPLYYKEYRKSYDPGEEL